MKKNSLASCLPGMRGAGMLCLRTIFMVSAVFLDVA